MILMGTWSLKIAPLAAELSTPKNCKCNKHIRRTNRKNKSNVAVIGKGEHFIVYKDWKWQNKKRIHQNHTSDSGYYRITWKATIKIVLVTRSKKKKKSWISYWFWRIVSRCIPCSKIDNCNCLATSTGARISDINTRSWAC